MKSYKELEIYQVSKKLAIEIHRLTLTLPKFELYEEGSQIRRSSKGITSMIVEGYARRRYKADFIKYLIFAQAECDETMLLLEFLFETESLKDKDQFSALVAEYQSLSKRINKFTQWAEENLNDYSTEKPATSNL